MKHAESHLGLIQTEIRKKYKELWQKALRCRAVAKCSSMQCCKHFDCGGNDLLTSLASQTHISSDKNKLGRNHTPSIVY